MNYLGIDYGRRRIGLAIGDDQARLARPLTVLENSPEFGERLESLINVHHIEGLVLGLPRGLEGQDTAQTNEARRFGERLQKLKLPVSFQDEALTSQKVLADINLWGGKRKRPLSVDSAAAAIILQDYLDNQ